MTLLTRPSLNRLAVPIFFEFLLGMLVALLGLWLAARHSDAAAGTLGVMQQVQETVVVLFRVLAIGAGVVVTQLLGADRPLKAKATATSALAVATWVGALATVILWGFRHHILAVLNAPPAVVALALPYLWLMAPALWLEGYNLTMAAVLRAHLRVRESLIITVFMHLTHAGLALPLMSGFGGFEGWGLMGFIAAFFVSRGVGLALHVWLWQRRLAMHLVRENWWRFRRELIVPVFKVGAPGASLEAVYRLGFMVSLSTAATLGVQALATQAYVLQMLKFILLTSLAIGWAVEIMVGRLVGSGELTQADAVVRKAVRNGLLASGSVALLAAASAPWLLQVFTRDPAIIAAAQGLLWMSLALELARVFNLIVNGALRATNDGMFAASTAMVSLILVLGTGSYLLGHALGLPGIWLAYIADEALRGGVLWWRWRQRGWLKHTRQWWVAQRREDGGLRAD